MRFSQTRDQLRGLIIAVEHASAYTVEGFSSKIGSKIGWKIGSPHPILDPILQRPTRIRVNPPDFKTGWVKIGSKIGWVRNLK